MSETNKSLTMAERDWSQVSLSDMSWFNVPQQQLVLSPKEDDVTSERSCNGLADDDYSDADDDDAHQRLLVALEAAKEDARRWTLQDAVRPAKRGLLTSSRCMMDCRTNTDPGKEGNSESKEYRSASHHQDITLDEPILLKTADDAERQNGAARLKIPVFECLANSMLLVSKKCNSPDDQ